MPKRIYPYRTPFDVEDLSYEQAVAKAADTGHIASTEGPLLEVVVEMLDALGRPDEYFDTIQIAGTNGKTSTTRMCAALLAHEGLRCGLYTSPHLVAYEERIEVAGRPVSPQAFAHGVSLACASASYVNQQRRASGLAEYTVTPFDILTVSALVLYAEMQVDVAVLEVGLGGRWDATSATDPCVVAITGIGLDHMRILGSTLEEIATEKAAIIASGRTVVLGEGIDNLGARTVIEDRCKAAGVEPRYATHRILTYPCQVGGKMEIFCSTPCGGYRIVMHKAAYQAQNAATAVLVAESYRARRLKEDGLSLCLDACHIPGRFDVLSPQPLLMVDACHNPQSCEHLVSSLDALGAYEQRPVLLLAALADKDVEGILHALIPAFPRIAVTQTSSDRAVGKEQLAEMVCACLARCGRPASDLIRVGQSPAQTLEDLRGAGCNVLAAGTITLAGEVYAYWQQKHKNYGVSC